jgi:predicted RNase H-like nuclease (RuvC/YqgF family)
MKMKSWIVWLLVVVFLVSEIFLFSTTCQKNTLMDSLGKSQQQVEQLQAQLADFQSSNVIAQNTEISRLRADNQDLPRLRNQVTQLQSSSVKLQAANQKLKQQLNSTLTVAQQQQAQLQQLAVENQQVRAVTQQLDAEAVRNQCINHLRQIDAAKDEWALENNKVAGDIPTVQDIAPYIKLDANGNIPGCPSGGTYTIGAVGVNPTCSIPGHVLP